MKDEGVLGEKKQMVQEIGLQESLYSGEVK